MRKLPNCFIPYLPSTGAAEAEIRTEIIAYLLSAYYRLDNRDSINHYMAEGDKVAAGLPATNAEVQGYHESLCDILTKWDAMARACISRNGCWLRGTAVRRLP